MDNYKETISKHLGRTSNGELMKPYEAPLKHDPSLLVPIAREVGRNASHIDASQIRLNGLDIWHAYEFSYLDSNNQPITGTLKFSFPADSKNMIESKSFKLYLNSFDFEQFEDSNLLINTIREDVSEVAGCHVDVCLHPATIAPTNTTTIDPDKVVRFNKGSADRLVIKDIVFDENIDVLKTFRREGCGNNSVKYFHTANLRSACEITNQKDTGHCFIAMSGDRLFDEYELARYVFSLRGSQHFHENVTEIMYNKLMQVYNPTELFVANIYNRRGGLDIHPIRFTSYDFANHVWFKDHMLTSSLCTAITSQV